MGDPDQMNKLELERILGTIMDYSKKYNCSAAYCLWQNMQLGGCYRIEPLERAEKDIQQPSNQREFIIIAYTEEYILSILRGVDQGLDLNQARELAKPLIRNRRYYTRMKDSIPK